MTMSNIAMNHIDQSPVMVDEDEVPRSFRTSHEGMTLHDKDHNVIGTVLNYAEGGICVEYDQSVHSFDEVFAAKLMYGNTLIADGEFNVRWKRLTFGKYRVGMMLKDQQIDELLIKRLDASKS